MIKPNFANSLGCRVKPAKVIQFVFPFTVFPKPGMNGKSKNPNESKRAKFESLPQSEGFNFIATKAAGTESARKKSCFPTIANEFPDS